MRAGPFRITSGHSRFRDHSSAEPRLAHLINCADPSARSAVPIVIVVCRFATANSTTELLVPPTLHRFNTNAIGASTTGTAGTAAQRKRHARSALADIACAGVSIIWADNRGVHTARCWIAAADGAGVAVVTDYRFMLTAKQRIARVHCAGVTIVAIQPRSGLAESRALSLIHI